MIFKHIHMTAALASGAFFLLRGLWMMQESSLFNARLVRVLPHVIDTILLVSALVLVGMMGKFPVFVLVKVVALFVYIALGMMAFRFLKSWGARVFMFFSALVVYAFIVSVAISKHPQGFLSSML
ncbi:MAG: SirB2 family protein [Gammaproteobacteria bacterium]